MQGKLRLSQDEDAAGWLCITPRHEKNLLNDSSSFQFCLIIYSLNEITKLKKKLKIENFIKNIQ